MDSIEQQTEQEHQLQLADLICKEANQYLDGQEIDMLLAKAEMYQKLEQLGQLNLDDSEVEPISSEVYFRPGSIQLGYLTNDPSAPSTEHYEYMHMPLSSSQSSIELANRYVDLHSCVTMLNCMRFIMRSELSGLFYTCWDETVITKITFIQWIAGEL